MSSGNVGLAEDAGSIPAGYVAIVYGKAKFNTITHNHDFMAADCWSIPTRFDSEYRLFD